VRGLAAVWPGECCSPPLPGGVLPPTPNCLAAGSRACAAEIVTTMTNATMSAKITAKASRSQGLSLPAWAGTRFNATS
jgi:hypothetical protein